MSNEPLRLIPALRMHFEKGSLQEPVVVGIQRFYPFQVPNLTLMHIPWGTHSFFINIYIFYQYLRTFKSDLPHLHAILDRFSSYWPSRSATTGLLE